MMSGMRRCYGMYLFVAGVAGQLGSSWVRGTDQIFEYTSPDNANDPTAAKHFGTAQFNVLNYPSLNGSYMMTATDVQRPQMTPNGNTLSEFYNDLQGRFNENPTATAATEATAASEIDAYTIKWSTDNGPKPNWIVLNEISPSLWDSTDPTYKNWLVGVIGQLHDTYGYTVVTYAPFSTVTSRNATYLQQISAKSYIAVENYLSGEEVMAGGTTYASRVAWAEAQYKGSISSFEAQGVPGSKIYLGEDFANTVAGTGWGRAGISASDWDMVIQIRQDAIRAAGFPGFLAYAWGGNDMGITEAEMIEHEYYYRSRLTLPGQQPQWLSDDAINVNGTIIPLSWSQPLNWVGGVPNAPGAVANFYKTNTASRTITLDGSNTVGTLSFNSASSYTIGPGSGGTLSLNNSGFGVNVTVPLGSHTIGVAINVADNVTFNITGSLSLTAGMSSPAVVNLTQIGTGTLTIGGPIAMSNASKFIASGGVTNFNSSGGAGLSVIVNAAAVNFNSAQMLSGLTINTGGKAAAAGVVNANTLAISGGQLDLANHPLVVRAGTIGTLSGGVYSGISGLVQAGRNGGAWNGNGIVTSQSAARGASALTTIAVAKASDALGITASQTKVWEGQTVNGSAVLAMYTFAGDADLSGKIDADDYFEIDSNINKLAASVSYFHGDFNYDGKINGDDYFIIDSNFASQGASLASAAAEGSVDLVPEPAYGGVILAAAGLLLSRGRRRRVSGRGAM